MTGINIHLTITQPIELTIRIEGSVGEQILGQLLSITKHSKTTPGELLTTGAAAKRLGVSPQTLRRWESEGRITPRRTPGGDRRYNTADIESLQGGAA